MITENETTAIFALLIGMALLKDWDRDTDMDGTAGTQRDKAWMLAIGAVIFFYFMKNE